MQSTVVEILCCGNVGMKERRKDRKAPPQLLFLTNDGTVHTRRAFTFETGRHRSYLATHSSFENICGAYSGIVRQKSYHNNDKEVGKDVHFLPSLSFSKRHRAYRTTMRVHAHTHPLFYPMPHCTHVCLARKVFKVYRWLGNNYYTIVSCTIAHRLGKNRDYESVRKHRHPF